MPHIWRTLRSFASVKPHLLSVSCVFIAGCFPDVGHEEQDLPIRGLITEPVADIERSTVRRYPGVLEPGEVNVLSFEVGGRLGRLGLDAGQRVAEGDLLTALDVAQFETEIQNRRAAIEEAETTLLQAEEDLVRSLPLAVGAAHVRSGSR